MRLIIESEHLDVHQAIAEAHRLGAGAKRRGKPHQFVVRKRHHRGHARWRVYPPGSPIRATGAIARNTYDATPVEQRSQA